MEVESLEKRDTGLDSRRLQKVKRQIFSRMRQRSSIRGRKSSRNTMTREQANRRGSVSLSSIPARSLSPRGIPPEGGGVGRTSFGPWQTQRRTRCREEPARNESRDRS